ncbi:PH domain-containing protein [Brachybacterium subflavum]|uniref:PH domain-containing protein n=1 Tax=Brachybacterium subflavum TaxID=2585206 RepID=UPI00187A25FC|nr:PH domain-containing protein [Brachybacterium subflavum]
MSGETLGHGRLRGHGDKSPWPQEKSSWPSRYGDLVSLADPTHAEQTFFAVLNRNDEVKNALTIDLPGRVLDPEETVIDTKIGDIQNDTTPILLATDRRVVLTRRRAFGSWKILKEAPAAQVVGVDYKPTLLSGKLRVHLRDGAQIVLKTATKDHAERFVSTMHGLLGR